MTETLRMWYHSPVIVTAGDWSIREWSEARRGYAVSCAGNFRGWFAGPDEIEAAFPFPRGEEMSQN
jgi:hypothetical protein